MPCALAAPRRSCGAGLPIPIPVVSGISRPLTLPAVATARRPHTPVAYIASLTSPHTSPPATYLPAIHTHTHMCATGVGRAQVRSGRSRPDAPVPDPQLLQGARPRVLQISAATPLSASLWRSAHWQSVLLGTGQISWSVACGAHCTGQAAMASSLRSRCQGATI